MRCGRRIWTLLGIAAGLILATNSTAAIINVPLDQPTIQAAINAAMNGDEVVVAQGEYFENINFNGKAITLRSSDPSDPLVVAATIINGGGSGSVVTCTSGEGSNTVLSGFVITGGTGTDVGGLTVGGGMYNDSSSPTVSNCTFSGNSATQGGGMINDNSDPTVTDCTFTDNSTIGSGGGGMWNVFSSPTVTNCWFMGNTTTADGGGMFNGHSNSTVTDCTFIGNTAIFGGGGMYSKQLSPTVTNCTFMENTANAGAGMYNDNTSQTVANCTFSGNSATERGGGMYSINGSSPTVIDCMFSGNSAGFGGNGIHNSASNRFNGGGDISGSDDFRNDGGEVSPASSDDAIGLLTLGMTFMNQLGPAGGGPTLVFDLGGTISGSEHDQIVLPGPFQLNFGLRAELIKGFTPQLGDCFAIVTAPSLSGQFDVAFFPGLPGGLFMRVEYNTGGATSGAGTDEVVIVVDNLLNLFGFGDPESVDITGLPSGVAVGDFDNQNGVDLAITIPDANPLNDGTVLVLLNAGTDGGGNWLGFAGSTQTTVGRVPSGITVGLLDADGNLDIAVTNAGDDNVSVLINDGAGVFTVDSIVDVGTNPSAIAAGDFGEDGSGDIDLAVANEGDNSVQILTNNGAGVFNPAGGTFLAGTAPVSIEWDDIDDNKDIDLVVANHGSDDISIFLNAGGGSFGPAISVAVGDAPVELATGDLDLNGTPDIVTANNGDGTVSVILNNGDGTFVPAVNLPVGALPRSLTAIDLEGDLDFDVVVVANDEMGNAVVQVLRNDLTAGQLIFAAAAELVTGTDPAFVITGDLDGDLDEDLITVNEGLGAPAAAGAGTPMPPGPAMGSVNVSLNALVTPCPPDVNGDGVVNVLDLIDLLLCFGQPAVPGCSPEDVNGDGTVNVLDLIDLLLAFGTACP